MTQKILLKEKFCTVESMENISWTDRIKNEEGLHRFMEERSTIQTVKRKKASWIES